MTQLFPKEPAFSGAHLPARVEADVFDLEVEGEVPASLAGSWIRVGSDTQFPPSFAHDMFINGDGFMSKFRFEDGHVDMRTRYIKTDRLLAERAARRNLFGPYRNPYTDDETVRGVDRTTANTSPIWHGGKLLMAKEDGRPYEVDPETLETKGSYDWNGALRSKTVTAHPKIDPETGELFFFGYEANGDGSSEVAFCIADRDGKLTQEQWFDPPYVSLMHDFAITRNYVIFPVFPTTMDPDRLRAGGSHWAWDGSKETLVGVMPRGGAVADIRWFRKPASFAYHVINAFDEDGKIFVDTCEAQINPFPFFPNVDGSPRDPSKGAPWPTRWTIDMTQNGDGFTERRLGPPADMPRVDDRLVGKDYRYVYLAGLTPPPGPGRPPGPSGLVRLDVKTGGADRWNDPNGGGYQESQFIPSGAGEAAGFLLGMVTYPDLGRSQLHVFDAEQIAKGPVAKVHIPLHLRSAIHTVWIAATASQPAR